MTPIADFIIARLTEDCRAADGLMFACRDPRRKPDFGGCGGPAAEEFFARFNPARTLREVEADRKLLAAYQAANDRQVAAAEGRAPAEPEWHIARRAALDFAVAVRAAIYSDHPDYGSWAPAAIPDTPMGG